MRPHYDSGSAPRSTSTVLYDCMILGALDIISKVMASIRVELGIVQFCRGRLFLASLDVKNYRYPAILAERRHVLNRGLGSCSKRRGTTSCRRGMQK